GVMLLLGLAVLVVNALLGGLNQLDEFFAVDVLLEPLLDLLGGAIELRLDKLLWLEMRADYVEAEARELEGDPVGHEHAALEGTQQCQERRPDLVRVAVHVEQHVRVEAEVSLGPYFLAALVRDRNVAPQDIRELHGVTQPVLTSDI